MVTPSLLSQLYITSSSLGVGSSGVGPGVGSSGVGPGVGSSGVGPGVGSSGVGVSPPDLSTLSFSTQVLVLPERVRSISSQSAVRVIVCSVGLTDALLVLAKSSVVAMRDDTAVVV